MNVRTAAVVDDGLEPVAVPLDLEQPVGVVERVRRERREHRLDEALAAAPRPRPRGRSPRRPRACRSSRAPRAFACTSSFVRPVFTDCGRSSASQPADAWASRFLISSHCSESSSNAVVGAEPGRRLVRTIVKRPRSFSPWSSNFSSPSSTAFTGSGVSASGTNVPQSQTITSPAPYWPRGITPSKSKYSIGWSSTWTAIRRIDGVERRSLGDRPAREQAVDLEAEVVVEAGRAVALDDEAAARRSGRPAGFAVAGGLRRLAEIALAVIAVEGHERRISAPRGKATGRSRPGPGSAGRRRARSAPRS